MVSSADIVTAAILWVGERAVFFALEVSKGKQIGSTTACNTFLKSFVEVVIFRARQFGIIAVYADEEGRAVGRIWKLYSAIFWAGRYIRIGSCRWFSRVTTIRICRQIAMVGSRVKVKTCWAVN